jgi:hypothetical protein
MLRLLLISFSCVFFAACSSSDDAPALNEWFNNQNIATSYGKDFMEIDVSVKDSFNLGFDNSAYMVSSYAALGNVNGVEQLLYFGLEVLDSLSPIWKLRTDSIFYADIYKGVVPDEQKTIDAKDVEFCWRVEDESQHDSLWLMFPLEPFKDGDCKQIKSYEWKAGTSRDTFSISLPDEFLKLKADTLRLLAGIRLLTNNTVLRIAPPSKADIPGLLRVAQKTKKLDKCEQCLHAGVRESLSVAFEINENDKKKIAGRTVVFAELVLDKISDAAGSSELGFPVPVHVYSENGLEEYKVDNVYVEEYGHHPNLVFLDEYKQLKLQVKNSLRNYAMSISPPDTFKLTLRLGFPMLNPKSLVFYNSYYSPEKVFAERPAYARADFSSVKTAKLRLWFADYGNKK